MVPCGHLVATARPDRKPAPMIVELATILSLFTGGYFWVRAIGLSGWGSAPAGFLAGVILLVLIGAIQIIAGLPSSPVLTLLLTVFISTGVWIWGYKNGRSISIRIIPACLLLISIALAVVLFYHFNILNLSPDSYRYAQIGSLMESGHIDAAQPSLLLKRQLAVPIMHASANIMDKLFLTSITPLLSLATVFILSWFCMKGANIQSKDAFVIRALPVMAALLLITNQFFVFNAFYVNGHMLYAALLLLTAGCFWLYAQKADVSRTALIALPLIAIPALTATRPEAPLHMGLTLAPVLVSDKFSARLKVFFLTDLCLSTVVWNGFLGLKFTAAGLAVPVSVLGLFSIGLAGFMVIPLFFTNLWKKIASNALAVLEICLWLGLLIAALKDQEMFIVSISAAVNNIILGLGLWGYSIIVLAVLFFGSIMISKAPHTIFLRYPITTFIPLALISAFLRGHSYRVGPFDSFNRMCLHVVPIAILLISASAASKHWNDPK